MRRLLLSAFCKLRASSCARTPTALGTALVLQLALSAGLPNLLHAQTAKAGNRKPGATTLSAADTLDPVLPSIDHSTFDRLLHEHVSKGLVDYAAFRNNTSFASYLASLNTVDPSKFEEAERIAFWLNVYNAYTIQLVASKGETESIRNIDKTFGVLKLKGPWSESFVKVAGQQLTLDDVEHRILRKEFSEPRVHFAMSLGAKGGPPLRNEAYTGAKLDDQLEDQARLFLLASPEKNRVEVRSNTVFASPILTRYRADFGASPSALGLFLAQFYPTGSDEAKLLRPRTIRIRNGGGGPFVADAGPPSSSRDSAKGGVKTGAALTTPVKRDSTKADSGRRFTTGSFFRLVETPFDWSLNIQLAKKP